MKKQILLFSLLAFLSACKPDLPHEDDKQELQDGTYLMDSSMGIKSYAVIKDNKISNLYALNSDGTLSDQVVVNILDEASTVKAASTCEAGCIRYCIVVDLKTGAFKCFCECEIATTLGVKVKEIQKATGETKIKSIRTKLILEVEPNVSR